MTKLADCRGWNIGNQRLGEGAKDERSETKTGNSVAVKSCFDSLMAGFFIRGSARILDLAGHSSLIGGDGRTQRRIGKNG